MSLSRHCARHPLAVALLMVLLTVVLTHCGSSNSGESATQETEQDKFTVNERVEIERAIGPTDGLPDELKRAFALTNEFTILPPPEPGDWLEVYPEEGQTFEEFVESRPNMPTKQRCVIYVLPLGEFDKGESPSMKTLAAFTQMYFAMNVQILEGVSLEDIDPTDRVNRYTGKRQLYTPDILGYLIQNLPDDAYCLIALTMIDLYPDPQWNYVFGSALLRERVGVFSFARYDPAFFGEERPNDYSALILERSMKVMSHEIGHMFGLKHCTFLLCNMNGSNSLRETDRAPLHLCPVCLRKLAYVTGLDVVDRYHNLADFYEEINFAEEAQWVWHRLDTITSSSSLPNEA